MSISCPEIENDEIFIVIKSHMRNNHRLNKSLLHKIYSRYFIYDYFARCHQLQHLPPIIEDQTEKNFLIFLGISTTLFRNCAIDLKRGC